jgi:hypothetical protein
LWYRRGWWWLLRRPPVSARRIQFFLHYNRAHRDYTHRDRTYDANTSHTNTRTYYAVKSEELGTMGSLYMVCMLIHTRLGRGV